jgi:hypothetical protein
MRKYDTMKGGEIKGKDFAEKNKLALDKNLEV